MGFLATIAHLHSMVFQAIYTHLYNMDILATIALLHNMVFQATIAHV
jgi:hypothetical protein